MRHLNIALAATGLLAVLGASAGHADGTIPQIAELEVLPNAAGYCNLADTSGTVDYTPAIYTGLGSQNVSWVMTLHLECHGAGIYNGIYDMVVAGSGVESCASGTGSGTVVSGSKSSGPGTGPIVGGTMTFNRTGLHYYISHPANGLEFTVAETTSGTNRLYTGNLWLDLPTYLQPNVAADASIEEPVIPDDLTGPIGLPRAEASVSVAPAPCIDAHPLVGHGFLGEKYGVLADVDAVVEQVLGGVG